MFEAADVVVLQQLGVRIFFFNGPEGRRRGEETLYPILLYQAPEAARIGCFDRFTFVYHRGAAQQQGGVNNIRVPDYPTHIRSGEEHFTWFHGVDRLHRVSQCHRITTRVAHNAFGLTRGTRGVENIQRVGALHGHAVGKRRLSDQRLPIVIIRPQRCMVRFTLINHTGIRFMGA